MAGVLGLVRRCTAVNPRLTAAAGGLVFVSGLLPTGFTLATGALAGTVPEAVGQGMGSEAGRRVSLALLVAAAVYVLMHVLGPFRATATDLLMRQLDESLATGLMRALSAPRGIAHLEDPVMLDRITQARGEVAGMSAGSTVVHLAGRAVYRLQGLAALVILARFRWWLVPVFVAGNAVSFRWRKRHWMDVTGVVFDRTDDLRHADYLRRLATRPEAAKETRVFSLAGWMGHRYRDTYLATMADVWRKRRTGAKAAVGVTTLMFVIEGGALALVAQAGVDGSISLAGAVVYAQAVLAAATLGRFDMDDMRLQDGLAAFRVVRELEEAVPGAIQHLGGQRAADGLPQRAIRFEGVGFRYPGRDEDVFSDLNLEIVAGQSLAIVGANGAGKTTLIKLLARLYDVGSGRITVDGIDLREFDPASWQRQVAAIFQDFVQYPVSAYDNVAFGSLDRAGDREAVEEAARRAGALGIVTSLPNRWETLLNRQLSGGAELSGGEWQRVALARALFAVSAGAGVLVLDEPTASLDVRAEADLYDRFLDLTRGVTTIVVSHRFSTVRRAQRIVVLEHGRVVEDGSHDELVAQGGRYASMFALQASRFTDWGNGA